MLETHSAWAARYAQHACRSGAQKQGNEPALRKIGHMVSGTGGLREVLCAVTLTSISRIIVPGASRTTKPTNIPAKMATRVSWIARMRLIWR